MRILRHFLEPIEREYLVRLAYDAYRVWTPGRRDASYEHTPIDDDCLKPLIYRCIGSILRRADLRATVAYQDAYLIRYRNGAHIPPHTDPPLMDGLRHGRLHALLCVPAEGGTFMQGASPQPFELRDAIVFYPDVEEHGLTPVVGERLIWSVGCHYRMRA